MIYLAEWIHLTPLIVVVGLTVVVEVPLAVGAATIGVDLRVVGWDLFADPAILDLDTREELSAGTPSIPAIIVTGTIARLILTCVHF